MPDIDFLANQEPDDDQEPKNKDDKAEKIIWSEPDEDKPLVKEAPFFGLSFFGKKQEVKPPALAPEPAINKNKIKDSRREILKLIKRHQQLGLKAEPRPGKNWLAGFIERFRKQPSHKEILIDYHQVINQEKAKRSPVADQLNASKFGSPARPAIVQTKKEVRPPLTQRLGLAENSTKSGSQDWGGLIKQTSKVQPAVDKKPVVARPIKATKDNFLSRFFKMIKDKMAALNRLKLRSAKTNLVGVTSKIEPEMAEPPLAKPAPEERAEIKIKAKPLEQKEPAQIKAKPLEILETNLIKGEIITFFDWHRKAMLLINAIFIPVFMIAVIYLGLLYYQKQNQAKVQEQVKKFSALTAEIKQTEIGLKEVTDFQTRLKIVSQIFAKHIYWTNLFKFLEDNTMKDVYYAGLNGDTSGDYSLDAVASKFSNISKQVSILRNNQKVTDVRTVGGELISNDAAGNNKVKFNINFSILKSIFTD